MKTRQIWILTEMYYPEETSTGYFLTQTAEGLATNFAVSVLTGPATNGLRPVKAPALEMRNGVSIYRCVGTVFAKESMTGRIFNLLTRAFSIAIQAVIKVRAGDAVMAVTNPPLLPFLGLVASVLTRSRFVLLVHDVYPEAMVAAGLLRPGSLLLKIGEMANRLLYRSCRRIVVLGRDMAALVGAKLLSDQTVVLIPNWAAIEEVQPMPKSDNMLLRDLGIVSKFVVLYAGNLGRTHGVEQIVGLAVALSERGSEIHILVAGTGAKRKWLTETVARQQIANVTLIAPCPRAELKMLLNACDVAVIPLVGGMKGVSVPSRLYNQLAAGRAVIAVADAGSELALVVAEERVGWVVSPDDTAGLVDAVLAASRSPAELAVMGGRAAEVARRKYSLTNANKAYAELFDGLFAAKPGK